LTTAGFAGGFENWPLRPLAVSTTGALAVESVFTEWLSGSLLQQPAVSLAVSTTGSFDNWSFDW
jgi:hypothetical protein